MIPIRNILVAVGFTEACRLAARAARELADRLQAEVHLLHVIEPPKPLFGLEPPIAMHDLDEICRAAAQRELRRLALDTAPGFQVHLHIAEGDPATEIVKHTHAQQVDLVLMPTRGLGCVRRLLLGSLTAKVLHDSRDPMWTGTHFDPAPVPDGRPFLCAVDLGPQSRMVITWAADLAERFGVPLELVHVLPASHDSRWMATSARSAKVQLASLASEVGAESRVQVCFGNSSSKVIETAAAIGAGLVVIGRGCHVANGRLPGIAYAVIRDAPCAVCSV